MDPNCGHNSNTDDINILLNFIFTDFQGYQITPGLSTNKQRPFVVKDGNTCFTNPCLSKFSLAVY